MGRWERFTGKMRMRGMLSEDGGNDPLPDEPIRPKTPPPTPTGHVPERPHETPTTRLPDDPGSTAGTRSYGSQGGTPSTRRIHNPTHFR